MKNLVPHRNVQKPRRRIKRLDVGRNPPASCPYVGEARNVTVRHGDGDEDVGVREGFDDVMVDVEDFDAVDVGSVFEELSYLGWRGEVVS